MNPIAIWCKFDDYLDWCYNYRIPNEAEFVDGFEYEFADFTITTPLQYHTKIKVFWHRYTVGDGWNKTVLSNLKSYLEAGYLRVAKADDRSNKELKDMKVFYFEVKAKELTLENNKIKGFSRSIENPRYKNIIGNGTTAKEAFDDIIKTFKVNDDGFGEVQNILRLETNESIGYQITSGGQEITKDNLSTLKIEYSDCLIKDSAMYFFSQTWPKNEVKSKRSEKVRPNLNFMKNIANKIKSWIKENPIHLTVVDTKGKYPSRYEPVTNRWKPVEKPVLHQPEKSPNRLVCIATKDRKKVKRVTWKWANYLVTKAPDKYEYVSKEVYRFLTKVKPGPSYIPNNIDKKYKRIPVEKTYIPQEVTHVNGKVVYIDHPEDTYEVFEHKFVYDDSADGKYHPYKKTTPNKSSSKKAKCKRKKSSPGKQQGVSLKKYYNDYEVSFFRKMDDKSGTAEFIYTVSAKTSEQAIYKASKKAKAEGAELPYFKPVVKQSTDNRKIVKEKGENVYKRVILPKIIDLPVRKDKKGNVVPWTVKSYRLATAEEKVKGSPAFIQTTEEVKTYTKYEITYHKNSNPFKKDKEKKWKHPIKDGRKKK